MADGQGPICISVINMKGGVGKTTVTAMLARYAAPMQPFYWGPPSGLKLKTLVVDLDPQANLSQALMGAERYKQFLDDRSPSIVELFNGYQPPSISNSSSGPLGIDSVIYQVVPNLHLIPSRFDFSNHLISAVGANPRVLAQLIADNFQDRDLIIIDCAPTESIFTQVAYHASGHILVPVKPEFLATIGFPLLEDSLTTFRRLNPAHRIDVIGVVINDSSEYQSQSTEAPEKRTARAEIIEESTKNDWYMFKDELRYSRGFPKIMRNDFSDSGDAPYIFRSFAQELFDRLGF